MARCCQALTAGDSNPALPKDKGSTTDLLVEFHVEDSLQLGASDGLITFIAIQLHFAPKLDSAGLWESRWFLQDIIPRLNSFPRFRA